MRRASLVPLAAVILTVVSCGVAGAAEPTPPAGRRLSAGTFIPRPIGEATGAAWDSLERFEYGGRYVAAESLSASLLRSLESEPRPDSLALSRASFYFANSRLMRRLHADDRGFEALERGVAIRQRHADPRDPLLLWAHVKAATLYGDAGHPQECVVHGEIAVRLLEPLAPPDSGMLAQAHIALAAALVAVGRDSEAGPHFAASLLLRERIHGVDSWHLVPVLAEYGRYLTRAGDLDRARALLQRAVHMAGLAGKSDFLHTALSRLSSFENGMGNVAESLDLAWRAYEVARSVSGDAAVPTLRARTVLAYRLQDFGDMRGSAAHLRDIIPGFEAGLGANHPQTLNARLALVHALIQIGDTTAAGRELLAARPALATQDPRTNSNLIYAMQLSADLQGLRGFRAAARETLAAAVGVERLRRDPTGARHAELLTHVMDNWIDPAEPAAILRAGVEVDRLRDSTRVRATPEWHSLMAARAAAEARAGLRHPAWEHALEAERLARERLAYQLEALPDLLGLQLARQIGRPCEVLAALVDPAIETEVATAWDRIVRWRGLVGHEIARRRAPVAAARDTSLTAAHARWVAAQRRLAQLVVSGAAHPADPDGAARFESARLEAERMERLFVRTARGFVSADSVVTLDRVLARLGPGQAIAAFALASHGGGAPLLGAFVATGRERRPRWVVLGPVDEIERDVRGWMSRLTTPPSSPRRGDEERACRRLGLVVRERLWDPIVRAAGEPREIVLVPEGEATELPWLALPAPGGRYLAQAPIAVRLLEAERDLLADSLGSFAGSGLLALGGPDFGRPSEPAPPAPVRTPRLPLPCGGAHAISLPELPAAREEAEGIARLWPAEDGPANLLLGAQASEAALKSGSPGKAVIHVATHGVMLDDACGAAPAAGVRGVGGLAQVAPPGARAKTGKREGATRPAPPAPRNPWLGRQVWLALAGANDPIAERRDENEGLLTAEEVVTLDLRGTEWVVLSACHSGVAPRWSREGTLGMRRAFHLAGARAVIASHWAIGDESTREWMTALYASRARGATASVAVGEASRAVLELRRAQGRSTHPFYWAAFSATGE